MSSALFAAWPYGLFQHELWRFGIIQHSDRGWYHMDAEVQHVMRLENIQPDTWIVPSRMTSYAAMGQLAETEYHRAGDEARANLLKGEDNLVTFRRKCVYETRPCTLDVDGRRIDPLNRTRTIGDFFRRALLRYAQRQQQQCPTSGLPGENTGLLLRIRPL